MHNTSDLHIVTIESCDLWNCGDGWTGNYCWRNVVTAAGPTRRAAIRKALAKLGKGWRSGRYSWAGDASWRIPGTCIGACEIEAF